MPPQFINLFLITYILCPQSNALYDGVHFGRFEKNQEDLHQISEEKACLQLHLLIDIHKHEF